MFGLIVAWIRYDLHTKKDPFRFTLHKVCGNARLMAVEAWESLGRKIINQIMEKTRYNVNDMNYSFCNVVHEHFREMHRIARGASLMVHCAREREHIATKSLDWLTERLSGIFIEYEDMVPFSKAEEASHAQPLAGQMEELAKELVELSQGDEPDFDSVN